MCESTVSECDSSLTGKMKKVIFEMKTIDKFINFWISLLLLPVMMSCSDTDLDVSDAPFAQPGDRAATIEVPLRLHADAPSVIGKPLVNDIVSRADGDSDTPADPEQAAEEAIKNIWVFQFDSIGNQLIAPRYYEVTSTEIRKLNIRLAEGEDRYVYVLANTCDPDWARTFPQWRSSLATNTLSPRTMWRWARMNTCLWRVT